MRFRLLCLRPPGPRWWCPSRLRPSLLGLALLCFGIAACTGPAPYIGQPKWKNPTPVPIPESIKTAVVPASASHLDKPAATLVPDPVNTAGTGVESSAVPRPANTMPSEAKVITRDAGLLRRTRDTAACIGYTLMLFMIAITANAHVQIGLPFECPTPDYPVTPTSDPITP